MNLANILYARTARMMDFVMSRSPFRDLDSSSWHYYSASEGMHVELTQWDELKFWRRNTDFDRSGAVVYLKNIRPSNTDGLKMGDPAVSGQADVQKKVWNLNIDEGVQYSNKFTHTFSKTTTLKEAAGVALELATKTLFGYKSGTATGGPEASQEFSAKVSAHYNREWGNTDVDTNTVEETFNFTGPWKGKVIAERSTSNVSIPMELPGGFTYSIHVMDNGREIYHWDSYETLLQVLGGHAPSSEHLGLTFALDPITPSLLTNIGSRIIPPIKWTARFQSVNYQDIIALKDKDDTQEEQE